MPALSGSRDLSPVLQALTAGPQVREREEQTEMQSAAGRR